MLKKHSNDFTIQDNCICTNFNYESLHSCLISYPKKSKDKIKEKDNQTDLVYITFGGFDFMGRNLQKSESKPK